MNNYIFFTIFCSCLLFSKSLIILSQSRFSNALFSIDHYAKFDIFSSVIEVLNFLCLFQFRQLVSSKTVSTGFISKILNILCICKSCYKGLISLTYNKLLQVN